MRYRCSTAPKSPYRRAAGEMIVADPTFQRFVANAASEAVAKQACAAVTEGVGERRPST